MLQDPNNDRILFDLKGSKFKRKELGNEDYKYLFRNENHEKVKEKLRKYDLNISMSTS